MRRGESDEWHRGEYTISTDRARIDIDVVHAFVRESYWAQGIPRDVVERAIAGSLCFGIYHGETQVGFCRVITDYATTGYLADVFVLPAHRGKKLSVWLMETVMAHPRLQNFRIWRLATRDAHGLYEKVGWKRVVDPANLMEISDPDVYLRAGGSA
jgi:GNAT superfamily N-acetyltransferase